ncbi:hypothetical protein ACLPAF_02515 [Proteus mirabilis]|uniref:hypothetical protein n=1 Tax=Enterobacterales TaxID=91347 RepID=UPI003891C035
MKRSVSNDEWPELAKRLPIGQKRRTFHSCSHSFSKTNFEYGRDGDGIWCKCHRCGYSKKYPLNHAPYVEPVKEQVKVPTDVVPLTEVIAKQPRLLLPALERNGLMPHISILKASPTYGRIYLPDDTGSFCGLDFTGRQFIPWRSPHKHSLAMKVWGASDDGHCLWVYGEAGDYLQQVRDGGNCAFVPNVDDPTLQALVSVALAYGYNRTVIHHHPSAQRIRREMRVLGPVQIIGE